MIRIHSLLERSANSLRRKRSLGSLAHKKPSEPSTPAKAIAAEPSTPPSVPSALVYDDTASESSFLSATSLNDDAHFDSYSQIFELYGDDHRTVEIKPVQQVEIKMVEARPIYYQTAA